MTDKQPELRLCAKDDCDVKFEARSHNQIYCSKAHQKVETNRKIMEKYYEKKAQRNGETRICESCSVTKLSMYNDSRICRSCEVKKAEARDAKALADIGRFIGL